MSLCWSFCGKNAKSEHALIKCSMHTVNYSFTKAIFCASHFVGFQNVIIISRVVCYPSILKVVNKPRIKIANFFISLAKTKIGITEGFYKLAHEERKSHFRLFCAKKQFEMTLNLRDKFILRVNSLPPRFAHANAHYVHSKGPFCRS